MPDIRYAQNENVDRGDLRMQVIERGTSTPIDDAKISISYSGDPDSTVEEVNTDASGMSETLTLDTPPLELSMQPSEVQPYAEYTIQVTAKGYRPINISGIEVFSGQLSLQEIRMDAEETTESMTDNIVIPAHTLFAEYPPKIAEAEIKPVTETGEIVLSRVVIPEYVIVHDGAPSDPTARDYYVRYRDYIKNVASSEIYSTWPDTTIRANVLAIMSFTLNRVYTEWYRNKGYSFTITSSTAYDQKFMYGRNIYQSISDVVDEMFQNYLSRPNVRQPILTQYCCLLYTSDTFVSQMMTDFNEYAAEQEEQTGIAINVEVYNAAGSQSTQNSQVEEMLDAGCNVICVNLVDRTEPTTIIDMAEKNNVPVIFFNRELVEEDLERWDRVCLLYTSSSVSAASHPVRSICMARS